MTWEQFKEELQRQFLSGNSVEQARKTLLKLRYTGTMRKYVQTFLALMLEIPDMIEADRKFLFLQHLQSWAQLEVWQHALVD